MQARPPGSDDRSPPFLDRSPPAPEGSPTGKAAARDRRPPTRTTEDTPTGVRPRVPRAGVRQKEAATGEGLSPLSEDMGKSRDRRLRHHRGERSRSTRRRRRQDAAARYPRRDHPVPTASATGSKDGPAPPTIEVETGGETSGNRYGGSRRQGADPWTSGRSAPFATVRAELDEPPERSAKPSRSPARRREWRPVRKGLRKHSHPDRPQTPRGDRSAPRRPLKSIPRAPFPIRPRLPSARRTATPATRKDVRSKAFRCARRSFRARCRCDASTPLPAGTPAPARHIRARRG